MGFFREKVVAPLAGKVSRHTTPQAAHRAVEAVGTDTVRAQQCCCAPMFIAGCAAALDAGVDSQQHTCNSGSTIASNGCRPITCI